MIPERMPRKASKGEVRTFELLSRLPDNCICYYEPIIDNRTPDFVVILPDRGILVIEVKGWYKDKIIEGDGNRIKVDVHGQIRIEDHPARQAKKYMFGLMDSAREKPHAKVLLNESGSYEGKFRFPFGRAVVMSNITRDQLNALQSPSSPPLFPENTVIARDELEALRSLAGDRLLEELSAFFNPTWSFKPLEDAEINALRSVIHPEVLIEQTRLDVDVEQPLKVLDLNQERYARSIGDGHRICYGVAGSGKTVLLKARAKLMARDPSKRILVLCYNKPLSEEFACSFADYPNIDAFTFHGWAAKHHNFLFKHDVENDVFGNELLAHINKRNRGPGGYDAVLIDEGQDFERSWFHCVKTALRDPDDGNLLVVLDGGQALYKRLTFTWKEAGIKASGRVMRGEKYGLNRNYRNTFEILSCAAPFATTFETDDDDFTLQAMPVDPYTAKRRGALPELIMASDRQAENDAVVSLISEWLKLGLPTLQGKRSPVSPGDIAILYPRMFPRDKPSMSALQKALEKLAPVTFAKGKGRPKPSERNSARREEITIRTIHSSKGLQYRAVIIIWLDLLPRTGEEEDVKNDKSLLYVGMTRAEDMLVLSSAAETEITETISSSIIAIEG